VFHSFPDWEITWVASQIADSQFAESQIAESN
jgi:hypothetical protein